MPANSVQLFEQLSSSTWQRMKAAQDCHISIGETTFTDLNLLDLRTARLPNVKIYKAQGRDEPEKGFDWEWWIGRDGIGWWRYSVQAKKLDLMRGTYADLRHQVAGAFQIDILDDFALSQKSIPLYCFYNHATAAEAAAHWHCPLACDPEQLGCSVVPLDVVKTYHNNRIRKSFANLHRSGSALPWRCLVRCPILRPKPLHISGSHGNPLAGDRNALQVLELPGFLRQPEVDISIENNSLYESEGRAYPERIMVVDLG